MSFDLSKEHVCERENFIDCQILKKVSTESAKAGREVYYERNGIILCA